MSSVRWDQSDRPVVFSHFSSGCLFTHFVTSRGEKMICGAVDCIERWICGLSSFTVATFSSACTFGLLLPCFQSVQFLLLACYLPNVAKRSTWEQCIILRTNDWPRILENFERPYLVNGSSDPLHVWFYGRVFEVGASNGPTSGWTKSNRHLGKFQMAISLQRVVRSTSCLILG